MLMQSGRGVAAGDSAGTRNFEFNFPLQLTGLAAFVAASVVLAGCTATPTPLAANHPANPAASKARTSYSPVTEPYVRMRPTEPSSWRERNDDVTPPDRNNRSAQ